jgi:hypothetical protein
MWSSMNVKLRGHHLICLNFFRGEGYSDDFIKNIYSVIGRENMEIVEGPDDICARCPYLEDDRCVSVEYTDEMIMQQDREALLLLKFEPGMMVDWRTISDKLPEILKEWKAKYCKSCGYRKVCFGKSQFKDQKNTFV